MYRFFRRRIEKPPFSPIHNRNGPISKRCVFKRLPLSKAFVLILAFGPFIVDDRRKHIKKYRCFGIHAKTYLVWSEPGHVWKKGIFPLCLSFPWLCLKKSLEGKVPIPMQQKALSNLLNNFQKYQLRIHRCMVYNFVSESCHNQSRQLPIYLYRLFDIV